PAGGNEIEHLVLAGCQPGVRSTGARTKSGTAGNQPESERQGEGSGGEHFRCRSGKEEVRTAETLSERTGPHHYERRRPNFAQGLRTVPGGDWPPAGASREACRVDLGYKVCPGRIFFDKPDYGDPERNHVATRKTTGGRTRTDTRLPSSDFESDASTNFATP